MSAKNGISPSSEDYLEMIYNLQLKNGFVRTTDIAAELCVSKPSVNRAINTLKAQDLVEHELYSEIKLTDKGINLAKNVLHRHTLIKKFLTDIIGVDEEAAEKEACRMEHCMSETTIKRLGEYVARILG
ncbi:MAG: Transcriptional regulator MntR [Firmicutes bacterium ADurb.Bin193]|nr:MAG: Transcriptional regulator MntR [Firmicutes bacterium ADurb.Bin193]